MHPYKCHAVVQGPACLKVGFMPYDQFPRHGRQRGMGWTAGLKQKARLYHMTTGCVQERAPFSAQCM